MKVVLRNPRRELDMAGPMRVHALLDRLDVNRESVLVIRGDTLVPGDALLDDTDTVEIRPEGVTADHQHRLPVDVEAVEQSVHAHRSGHLQLATRVAQDDLHGASLASGPARAALRRAAPAGARPSSSPAWASWLSG